MNSRFLLIDLQSSCYSARQIPLSTTLTYLSTITSSFRQTRGVQRRIASSKSPTPSVVRASEIRRPGDRYRTGNGPVIDLENSASTSSSVNSNSELDLFLELLPLRMKSGLSGHREIGELIEVVMDLGRKPIARFPSGDFVICEQPVRHEDLKHAISKVTFKKEFNRLFFKVLI